MKESEIEKRVVDLAWDHLGILGTKLVMSGNTGYPDRIFWIPGGKTLLIEFKSPGEKPTPKQKHVHETLRSLGYKVEVHDNVADAFEAVINAVETWNLDDEGFKNLSLARHKCATIRRGNK